MKEEVFAVCRAWTLGKGDYVLFLTDKRVVAVQIGTLAGTLAHGLLGGLVGLGIRDLSQAKKFHQLKAEIEAKEVDFDELVRAGPKNMSIPYADTEAATIYKKIGNAPLVIKTKGTKVSFSLCGGDDYKAAKEVLERILKEKFKAKGFWSSLTKM